MNELARRQDGGLVPATSREELVAATTEDWLAAIEKPTTKRSYTTGLRSFAAYLGIKKDGEPWNLEELAEEFAKDEKLISSRTLKAYAKALLDQGKKSGTVNHRLSVLRKWVHALEDEELIHSSRAEAIYHVRGPRGKNQSYRSHLSEDEVQEVIDLIGTEKLIDKRDRVLIATLYWTGLRRSELCALTVGQIKKANGYTILDEVQRKGGGQDFVKLQVALVRALREWLELAGLTEPDDPLFCAISKGGVPSGQPLTDGAVYHVVKKRTERAGFQGITPHALRRSGATNAGLAGAPSNVIQSWGHWKGRSMLDIYVQQTRSLDKNGSDFLRLTL